MQCRVTIQQARAYLAKVSLVLDSMSSNRAMSRLFKRSANGRERVLSIDGPASSFAGLPVFRWRKLPASVTAIDDATLLFVSKQDFQALCLAILM